MNGMTDSNAERTALVIVGYGVTSFSDGNPWGCLKISAAIIYTERMSSRAVFYLLKKASGEENGQKVFLTPL